MRFLKSGLTLLIVLLVGIAHAQVDLSNGLQAYYPFNGNANDASGNGNNPILVNDVTFTNDYYGKANSAGHFNGVSSYIQIPNSSSINFTGPNTICVWVKPEGFFKGKCHHNRVVMKGLDNKSSGNLAIGYSDHVVQNGNSCYIDAVDTLHQTSYGYATGITSGPDTPYIRANEWKSIVCTYDGTYARLYVNCALTIENYNPGLSFSNVYDLFIGKMDDPQFPYFVNGIIDEVRIYNRALNLDEIKAYSFSCADNIQNSTLCKGSLGDPIVNINFGNGGNPGQPLSNIVPQASTTYSFLSVFGNPASPIPQDGSYTVTNNVPANSNWFQGATDHTGDASGYMAFFNANPTPGEFYKQTVSDLCPGTAYQFSAWIANVLDPSRVAGVLPDVTFRIEKTDGTLIASYKTGGIAQSSSMTWLQYGFFFTTPSDGSTVVLKMINTNVGGTALPGNDFAIDDITFRACGPEINSSFNSDTLQTVLTVAPSAFFTLYGNVNPISNTYDYQWQSSLDGGNIWNNIPNSNAINISQTAPNEKRATVLYRMLIAQKGNINSANCKTVSNTITLNVAGDISDCDKWLQVNANGSGVKIGDLDVSGQAITVEAVFNRTQTYTGGRLYAGDIVSKHKDPADANYLLRPNSAEITTSNGYFITPPICDADLNKTYHVAMVYDGKTLKFYRNGFLMSQVSCSGNLYQNDYVTTVGTSAYYPNGIPDESLKGYVNEVRIWNVARSQSQIKQYVNSSLPNPQTQTGLLAYYTFDDLTNKQGNIQWNGTLFGNAQIIQTNPQCTVSTDSCNVIISPVTAGFTAPDTVCVNTSFTINNTTTGATTNYWNFCSPDLLNKPAIINLGNIGFSLNFPVYTDYVLVNGNYYMFLVNNNGGGSIVRLDFGNSLLNTPTIVNLSNVSSYLSGSTEGIQLVQNNGRWIAIVVGGDPKSFTPSQLVKIDFGSDITNTAPLVTNWGNIGNLSYPHDLYVFNENNHWYGFTANTYANNIVKFDFGADFTTVPAASTLLDLSSTSYPAGLYAYIKNNKHYLFISNAGTSGNNSTLVRLDFDNSFTNAPVIHELGNPGGKLFGSYDFTTVENCNQLIGMSANASDNTIARFSFPNADITQTPVFLDTVSSGQLNFPHSFSKLYHEGSDSYFFIPNAFNNTLSRMKISGCTNASRAGTSNANPGTISYNAPGTYTISLTVDEGLQTQAIVCKDIIVLTQPKQQPPKDTLFCEGTSLRLVSSFSNGTYQWSTGSTDSAITVSQPGRYWVQINNGSGCGVTDSFNVTTKANPSVYLGKDTGLCASQTILLNAGNSGSTYLWQDGSTTPTYTAPKGGSYFVTVTNGNKCSKTDTIKIADYPSPVLSGLKDVKICTGNSAQLSITANGTGNTYSWLPVATLNNPSVSNPVAKPSDTTNYTVTVTNTNGCLSKDTATVFVLAKPVVSSIKDTGICFGNSVTLQTNASNSSTYSWSPATGLDNANSLSPKASPVATTSYIVTAKNEGCGVSDTVKITIFDLPNIVTNNDTTVCGTANVQLSVSGGNQYQWSPAAGLSGTSIANPVAAINQSVMYKVTGTDKNGCVNKDSVQITNLPLPQFSAMASLSSVCAGDSVLLIASGGDTYVWQPSQTVLRPSDSSTYAVPVNSTTYTVQIDNRQCNTGATKDVAVAVSPSPQINIAKSNDIDCRNPTATLIATGGNNYSWSPAGLNDSSHTATIMVMPEATTVYTVTVATDYSCKATDTVTVKVNTNLLNQYPLPSAFTPNGDGINDCFGIKSWDVLRVDFQIYDQWGWLIFHSTDPSNVCWDGRYKGKNQLQGTYVYKIYAVTSCGIINKAGTFVLIKETH